MTNIPAAVQRVLVDKRLQALTQKTRLLSLRSDEVSIRGRGNRWIERCLKTESALFPDRSYIRHLERRFTKMTTVTFLAQGTRYAIFINSDKILHKKQFLLEYSSVQLSTCRDKNTFTLSNYYS